MGKTRGSVVIRRQGEPRSKVVGVRLDAAEHEGLCAMATRNGIPHTTMAYVILRKALNRARMTAS